MDSLTLITLILAATIQLGTPILYATLGEMVMEKAGILNLGVEGMMIMGAFTAFLVVYLTGNPWLAFMCGGLAAMLISALHGVICLVFQGSQVVSGLALTIFGVGLANYLGMPLLQISTTGFQATPFPLLCDIPVLGKIFFQQDPLVYLSYLMPFIIWFMFMRTGFGLHLRAVGENPDAVRAAGISPAKIRWQAILLGGFIVGMGGAYLSLSYMHMWSNNLSAGRGWIAVALVIFAFWNPLRAIFGAYLFGGVMALQLRLQAMDINILPTSLLAMSPYILTLLVLLLSSFKGVRKSAPAALGINLKVGE